MTTLTILAMGQSNAVGTGTGGAWSIPNTVTVWNCAADSSATNAGLGNSFVAATRGSAPFHSSGGNNLFVHAARYLAAELGVNIRLILVARSGFAISNWAANGSMYLRMKAVLAAASVTKVDAFLWHQGEADFGATGAYTTAWNTLLTNMTSDGYIDASTPIVLGELIVQSASGTMNGILRAIADASDRVALADIACFPMISPADNFHFTGPSLVRAGLEYARELMKLPGAFNHTPAETDYPYVTAAGAFAYTPTSGAFCIVRVKAENGKKSLIDSGGFVADRVGVWEFIVSGFTYRSSLSVVLLDAAGGLIQMVTAASGAGIPHIDGSTVLALGLNDRVYMGVQQVSGSNVAIAAPASALVNRLTVKYLGRN